MDEIASNADKVGKFRDILVAENVREMLELGYFPTDFTMYGCAYLQNNELYFKISSEASDIYQFVEFAPLHDIYPSNIMILEREYNVSSGMQEILSLKVKIELANMLRNAYSKEFFFMLNDFANKTVTDDASELLWSEMDQLEGLFNSEKLADLEQLTNAAYSCRRLTKHQYQSLLQRFARERRNMCDDIIIKDINEKKLYGIAYEFNSQMQYFSNALPVHVYKKKYELEQSGIFVTPIYEKTFWYNHLYLLQNVMSDFKKELAEKYNFSQFKKIKTILHAERKLSTSESAINSLINSTKEKYSVSAFQTLERYAFQWGISFN